MTKIFFFKNNTHRVLFIIRSISHSLFRLLFRLGQMENDKNVDKNKMDDSKLAITNKASPKVRMTKEANHKRSKCLLVIAPIVIHFLPRKWRMTKTKKKKQHQKGSCCYSHFFCHSLHFSFTQSVIRSLVLLSFDIFGLGSPNTE